MIPMLLNISFYQLIKQYWAILNVNEFVRLEKYKNLYISRVSHYFEFYSSVKIW